MALEEEFKEYVEKAKRLPAGTTDSDRLILYGLYKQATVGHGPANTSRPGAFDRKGRAEWDAWKNVEDMSKEEAMSHYIRKVKQLLE